MKTMLCRFLTVLMLVSPAGITAQNSKGVGNIQNNQQGPVKHIRAIIVGISSYKNIQKLQYAHTDALAFYRFLISPAGGNVDSNNVTLLLNEKATAAKIYSALDEMLELAAEGEQIIFYFSGHGDLETKTIRQNGFLLGYDAPTAAYMSGGTIGINYLQDYLLTLAEKNKCKVVLITDACRSGKLAGGTEGVKMTAAALQEQWQSITKILSSQAGELSYEDSKWGSGGGVFTFYLLRGLKGLADMNSDNNVTTAELLVFLLQNIPRETKFVQNPSISGDMNAILAHVDSLTLASLLNENPSTTQGSNQLAFKGFEDRILEQLDTSLVNKFRVFEYCIANNFLIDSAENVGCAWDIYMHMKDIPDAAPILNNMTRSLLAALQDKAQIVINNYLEGKDIPDSININQAYLELEHAVNMIDENYILYKHIKARYLFMKGGVFETDPEKQIAIINEALNLEPDGTFGYFLLGGSYSALKNYDLSMKYYRKTIELAPRWAYAWNNLGTIYTALEKHDSALYFYNKAIEFKVDMPEPYYNVGLTHYNQKNYEEAIKCQKKTLLIKPDYAKAYNNMGWVYYDQGIYDQAAENFRLAAEKDPYNNTYKGNLALVKIKQEKYDEAIADLRVVMKNDPDYNDGLYYLGQAFDGKGEYDKAIYYYKKCTKLDPYYNFLFSKIGSIYLYNLQEYVNAEENYRKYLGFFPNSQFTLVNLGNVYFNQEKYNEAITFYQQAALVDSTYSNAFLFQGQCYRNLDRDDEALPLFRRAIRLDSLNQEAWHELAKYYKVYGDFDEAIRTYKLAMKADTSYHLALSRIGDIYSFNLKKRDSAEIYYQQYAQIYPNDAVVWGDIGTTCYHRGLYDEALRYYNKSLSLDPGYKGTYNDIGNVYYEKGEYKTSIEWYRKALVIDSCYGLAFMNLGDVYEKMELYTECIEAYLAAMKCNTKYEYLTYTIGNLYTNQLKNYDKAVEYYNLYLIYAPDRYLGYQGLAYVYLRQGKNKKAEDYFMKAIEKEPGESWNYYNLACFYSLTKETSKALEYLEKAFLNGFKEFDHIASDSDMDNLRNLPEFGRMIERFKE